MSQAVTSLVCGWGWVFLIELTVDISFKEAFMVYDAPWSLRQFRHARVYVFLDGSAC